MILSTLITRNFFFESRIWRKIQSPKKRVIHMDKKTMTQTWGKRETLMYKTKSKEKLPIKNGRCESIKLSPFANRLDTNFSLYWSFLGLNCGNLMKTFSLFSFPFFPSSFLRKDPRSNAWPKLLSKTCIEV